MPLANANVVHSFVMTLTVLLLSGKKRAKSADPQDAVSAGLADIPYKRTFLTTYRVGQKK